ncbi:MAG: oligoendopeptidase F, partial [Clostridia bacterium]|nr:oligoendopeptidase F [Clostridia bacterium]
MTENRYKWAIEDIYPDLDAWEADFKKVEKPDFSKFRGKLGGAEGFLACMKKQEEYGKLIEKLSVYAFMKHDENTKDSVYDALLNRINSVAVRFGAETAFVEPELTALDENVIQGYLNDHELKDYDYALKCVLKNKAHVLSENEERLLSMSSEALSSFRDVFTKIDNADLPVSSFRYDGKTYPLTHGTYGVYLQSPDRNLRKKAFKTYYKAYISLMNTIAATYFGSVKSDVFYAKAKKYPSALAAAMAGEDVDVAVYKNLIFSVKKALPYLHEYMEEKKKALKLDKMYMYDVYVPTVENANIELEYDDAYKLVVEGLSVLGKEYAELLNRAHDQRWLDVYEGDGKRSGAYSIAVYDVHPYVLLNYQKTTHDVFTIAHEMGHSIHSYFSNRTQPYAKADYKIFVAEVASTVNEVLLVKYLLKKEKDVKLKKFLLSYLMEMIRTTLFRQTQFAEFEEKAHAMVEKGEPLNKDNLSKIYLSLNKKYYGKAIIHGGEIKYEWARIPHFYRAFYVYKYATGIISALAIADRILTEGESAVKDYFRFLSSGGSDGPVELLKIAGVDLTTAAPFEGAFKVFKDA